MRLPLTAKDDQAGRIGRCQICTGGDCDQSVAIRTPRITPSRVGPRKPGHSARFHVAGGAANSVLPADGAAGSFVVVFSGLATTAGVGISGVAGAGGSGFAPSAWARSRSSGVGVQRQWKSDLPLPLMPPVRTITHGRHPSRTATIAAAPRARAERRRLTAAQATRATLRVGIARI